MTLSELTQINDLINSIKWDNTLPSNYRNVIDYGIVRNQELQNYFYILPKLSSTKIDQLLENQKQYLLIENQKHLIFSTGNDTYKYEIITSNGKEEFSIDLTFKSISYMNKGTSLTPSIIVKNMNDGKYDEDNEGFIRMTDGHLVAAFLDSTHCKFAIGFDNKILIVYGNKNESLVNISADLREDDKIDSFYFSYSNYTGNSEDFFDWITAGNGDVKVGDLQSSQTILEKLDLIYTTYSDEFSKFFK